MARELKILEQYQCWKGECPESCCRRWEILADQQIIDKWRPIKNFVSGQKLVESITTTVDTENKIKHVLHQSQEGDCIHLSNKGLCNIQLELGAEYIPEICRDFPHYEINNDIATFRTARLSCPAIVGLLYDNCQEDLLKEPLYTGEELSVPDATLEQTLEKMLLRVMAHDSISLNIRLYYLADTLSQLAELSAQGGITKNTFNKLIKTESETIIKRLEKIGKKVRNNKIRFNKQFVGGFWQIIFYYFWPEVKKLLHDFNAGEFFNEIINWDPVQAGDSTQHYLNVYNYISKRRSLVSSKYPKDLEKFISQYLLLRFMNNEFPLNPAYGNHILSFLMSIIPVVQVLLLVWISGEKNRLIKVDEVISLVVKTEKMLTHSNVLYKVLDDNPQLLRLDHYAANMLVFI